MKWLYELILIGFWELNFYCNLDMEYYFIFLDLEKINLDEENDDIFIVISYVEEEKIVKINRKYMFGGLKVWCILKENGNNGLYC